MSVRILVADDHDIVREGVISILRQRPDWEVIAEAENGEQALSGTRQLKPDLTILDIRMPLLDGLTAAEKIKDLHLGTKVLIFTMHDSSSLRGTVEKAGANGYVLKSHASRDLIRAVDTVLEGGTFFSESDSAGTRTLAS